VEAFFVVVMAALMLTVGVWALVATRRVLGLANRPAGDD